MQNSVAPVAAVSRAASTSDGMSSRTARTGVSKRPDCEQKWQSSGQPPVLIETMPSTSTSGPHQRIRTSWASVERVVDAPRRAAAGPAASAPRRGRRPARGPAHGRCRGSCGDLQFEVGRAFGQRARGAGRSIRGRPGCSATARSGSRGQEPITMPRQVRPRRSIASTVSAVWLSVPRPARATTISGASSSSATSAIVPPSPKRTSRPPAPSMTTRSSQRARRSRRSRAA